MIATVPGIKKTFIQSGQVTVSEKPIEFVTILGSCVSVCLWNKKSLIGGINHFLLPETVNDSKSLKGGVASTRHLIQMMIKSSPIKNLEASVFGGANRFFTSESFLHVGSQNVQAAKIVLAEAGIPIVWQDTGGETGRKIYFNTQTGQIRLIRINYSVPVIKLG